METSDVFKKSKLDELQPAAEDFYKEAGNFKMRLIEVMNEVLDKESTPAFLPLALELKPSGWKS